MGRTIAAAPAMISTTDAPVTALADLLVLVAGRVVVGAFHGLRSPVATQGQGETPRSQADEPLLAAYFRETPLEDAAWGLRFLLGPRPRRAGPSELRCTRGSTRPCG